MQATAAATQAQASAANRAAGADERRLAAGLHTLIQHLHKNCNSDLLEAVGALELSLTQIKLLHHLEQPRAELTLKQGAEAVRVSLPAASRLVDDLVVRGFIEREEDAADRRMKRIRITKRGREVIGRLNSARLTGIEDFVTGLSGAERRALATALDKLLGREDIAAARPQAESLR